MEEGRLVQTYEIFDLKGLGTHMLTMTVLNFTRDILLNFATHYPSSFRKAAIINAPSFLPRFWRLVAMVLPRSVKAKVVILGTDYHEVLSQDLGEEALAWVEASNFDLGRAPFRRRHSSSSLEDEEPLDGEAVLVEESD